MEECDVGPFLHYNKRFTFPQKSANTWSMFPFMFCHESKNCFRHTKRDFTLPSPSFSGWQLIYSERLFTGRPLRYTAELWIHKWQIGSNCQPWCPKGSWAVSLLLGSPTLSRKTRTEHVDVRDGARLLWIRGSLSGMSLGDRLPSFRPCLKAS